MRTRGRIPLLVGLLAFSAVLYLILFWNPPLPADISVKRTRVVVTNKGNRPWPTPILVELNGAPPTGFVYRHDRPVAPGETVDIPVSKFTEGGKLPTLGPMVLVKVVVHGHESAEMRFYPPEVDLASARH